MWRARFSVRGGRAFAQGCRLLAGAIASGRLGWFPADGFADVVRWGSWLCRRRPALIGWSRLVAALCPGAARVPWWRDRGVVVPRCVGAAVEREGGASLGLDELLESAGS